MEILASLKLISKSFLIPATTFLGKRQKESEDEREGESKGDGEGDSEKIN